MAKRNGARVTFVTQFRIPLAGLLAMVSAFCLLGVVDANPVAWDTQVEGASQTASRLSTGTLPEPERGPLHKHTGFPKNPLESADDESQQATIETVGLVHPWDTARQAATGSDWIAAARAFLIPHETGPPHHLIHSRRRNGQGPRVRSAGTILWAVQRKA